ncbi:SpoIIE family protein phosphatase [Patescibacteria group bacterium]
MKLSIRTKLIFAFSLLLAVVFALSAYLLINEKEQELAEDIYSNTLAFVKLTASDVSSDYDLYLAQNSFIYFNRQIQDLFDQNNEISEIKVYSYQSELLYDSSQDVIKKYDGETRMTSDTGLVSQIQSEYVSFKTLDGRILFVKNGSSEYSDEFGITIEPPEKGSLIEYFVFPGDEKTSVLYSIDYSSLETRVANMQERIIYLALLGLLLGILFSYFLAISFTNPIKKLVNEGKEIAKGNFKARVEINSRDEFGFLGKSFNAMARDLEVSIQAKVYQERLSRELELAADIQKQIVPDNVPFIPGLDIAAGLLPAGDIGGDMYDFLPLHENRLLMYLGDVTGHGVPAGIVSSIASALFFGYSILGDMTQIIIDVNRVFNAKTLKNIFMTLCLIDWDAANKKLSYVSAGHEQLVHYRERDKKAVLTPAGGLAIGMIPDLSRHVNLQDVDFQIGDFILCYSDGIPEAWQSETEQYGMDRLIASVEKFCIKNPQATSADLHRAVIDDLINFTQGYEQMDDVTLLILKRI